MAATWRGAWRSRVSSTESGSADIVHHPNQRPPQPYLADYINNNYGISSTTTASSATCTTLSNTTYTTTASSSSASALAARVLHSFMPAPNTSTLVVEEDTEEVGHETATEQDKAKTREHMRDLIHGSDPLDRWLWELQVIWVLHLAQLDASAGRAFVSRRLQHTARSWVLALHGISRSIVSFTGWCPSQEEEDEALQQLQTCWPPTSELVGFFAATFSHMLPFVDVVVALEIIDPSASDDDHQIIVSGSRGGVASAHKFQALADVRDGLAGALEHVQLWDSWLSSSLQLQAEAKRASGRMCRLLLVGLDRLDEAIRDTRDYIKTQFMSLMGDRHHDSTASGLAEDLSPGIHKATKSALSCIIVLSTSYKRCAMDLPTIHEAPVSVRVNGKDAPAATGNENTSSSSNLIMVMIRSLEEKLTRASESFPDQSLRFLFLINNLYFVWHQLRTNQRLVDVPMYALTHKIDGYINSYIQVSWTPVLKPLHDHTPCCLTRYSAQHNFETKFEKTYIKQKLWKVPDPELREELRAAIIKKVIPAFTKFLEDNVVSASRVTPKELEEMLEELFEG
ncbi:uncharacterized protein [Miscanthus floridulus]|uniref:uncharacterized protein n=1 Tax=Miscanthus floridulus TaxID=154761 RepID=UPI003459EEA1